MRRTSITVALLISVQFLIYAAAPSQTKSAAGGFGIAAPVALKHQDSTMMSGGLWAHELSGDVGPRSFHAGWLDVPAELRADGETWLIQSLLPDSGAVGSIWSSLGGDVGKQVVHEIDDD